MWTLPAGEEGMGMGMGAGMVVGVGSLRFS